MSTATRRAIGYAATGTCLATVLFLSVGQAHAQYYGPRYRTTLAYNPLGTGPYEPYGLYGDFGPSGYRVGYQYYAPSETHRMYDRNSTDFNS
jgi:hypothetical protein